MKPRTKLQAYIFDLAQYMPKMVEEEKAWAFENCITHWGYRTKTNTSCLSCGHIYNGHKTDKTEKCPSCNRLLTIEDTRKKVLSQRRFIAVLDVVDEFQVNRFFELTVHSKAGQQPQVLYWEIVQQWMTQGKLEIIARNRGGMGWYQDGFHGYLEIRERKQLWRKYNLCPDYVYPQIDYLPIYERNGFTGDFGCCSCYDLFTAIVKDSKAETLIKAGQMGLLAALCSDRQRDVERYWNSIKICMRNNYVISEDNAITWLDYMCMLTDFNKDLRNYVYVCPTNLHAEHQLYLAKKMAIRRREQEQRNARDAAQREKARKRAARSQKEKDHDYITAKGAYFGVCFTDGELVVEVLKSMEDFMKEGEILNHCVYERAYFDKPDSLILSARINGKPIETIEFSLAQNKILQARGWDNKPTEYHDKIIKLVNHNIHLIRKKRTTKKYNSKAIAA